MKEIKLICDRCGESGEWDDPAAFDEWDHKWGKIEADAGFELFDNDTAIDLCPECVHDLEKFLFEKRDDLPEWKRKAVDELEDL